MFFSILYATRFAANRYEILCALAVYVNIHVALLANRYIFTKRILKMHPSREFIRDNSNVFRGRRARDRRVYARENYTDRPAAASILFRTVSRFVFERVIRKFK